MKNEVGEAYRRQARTKATGQEKVNHAIGQASFQKTPGNT